MAPSRRCGRTVRQSHCPCVSGVSEPPVTCPCNSCALPTDGHIWTARLADHTELTNASLQFFNGNGDFVGEKRVVTVESDTYAHELVVCVARPLAFYTD
jgi:hypothetical protein